jgi:hypothetical protein
MFDDVPRILDDALRHARDQFLRIISATQERSRDRREFTLLSTAEPPADALTLRLFLDFGALRTTLAALSVLQWLHLSNNVLPPGPPDTQLAHLVSLQALLAEWASDGLAAAHAAVNASHSPLFDKAALLAVAPRTPLPLLHLLVELLKLPLADCERFRHWSQTTSHKQLVFTVRLLAHDPALVLHVKQTLAPDHGSAAAAAPAPAAAAAAAAQAAAPVVASSSSSAFGAGDGVSVISVVTHPPTETVYNRLLKPYPAVRITGEIAGRTNHFVDCTCVDANSHVEVPLCLQGTSRVKLLPTAFAQFKKLKLALTTQQQGCQFRLRFQLQTYHASGYVNIAGAEAYSVPITVFSHTQYLGRNDNHSSIASTLIPQLAELIPNRAASGSKLCLLGSGFVRSSQLQVRIGGTAVTPTFHETGTLVCHVPAFGGQRGLLGVSVSNDGQTWSDELPLEIA